jgi:hypothetical protein
LAVGGLFVLAVILAGSLLAVGISRGQYVTGTVSAGLAADLGLAVAVLSFAGVGALLVVRGTGAVIGAICLALGLGSGVIGFATAWAAAGLAGGLPLDGDAVLAAWISGWSWIPFPMLIVLLCFLFPDGRLPSPRWRPLTAAIVGVCALLTVAGALRPGPLDPPLQALDNPFGVPALAGIAGAAQVAFLVFDTSFVGAIAAQIIRFRRAGPSERAQQKWFAAAASVFALAYLASSITYGMGVPAAIADALILLTILALAGVPIAIGLAVSRYRLYEIDRLISRSIGWGLVTSLLGALFAGAVLLLQAVLSGITQGETLAVAASTLLAFALFQPLRRRVQAVVDRRFDRAGFDRDRTAATYAERVRDVVAIDALAADLSQTVRGSLRPDRVILWLREPGQ